VTFGASDRRADLPFPIPGMSDVMPYPSTVWSTLGPDDLERYRRIWRERITAAVERSAPDVIHTHHLWLMSSLIRDAAPDVPIVATCHATGLRQMELCPDLRDEVVAGCRKINRFCVLSRDHAERLADSLGIEEVRIHVVGAGFREDLFFPGDEVGDEDADQVLYVGKYSSAKGLPWLLDAVENLAARRPRLRLHVAGAGAGDEAEALRDRMKRMAPRIRLHGQLDQPALADLMRRCRVCVLPSFFEGVPLVLVEAAACGCRIVATDLPGVREQIAPALGGTIALVPTPRLETVDRPADEDLPAFAAALEEALARALDRRVSGTQADLEPFTWRAVFRRIENIWRELAG
jgi:glycosyltransferase involved in cell wall biosynthesis